MNQPPRSGKKTLYTIDNESSRPPLLQKESLPRFWRGETFLSSVSDIPKLRLTAMGWGELNMSCM
jgi:hypothetical protein